MSLTYTTTITKNRLEIHENDICMSNVYYQELEKQYMGFFVSDYEHCFKNSEIVEYLTKYITEKKAITKAITLLCIEIKMQDLMAEFKSEYDQKSLENLLDFALKHFETSEVFDFFDGFAGLKTHASRGYSQGDYSYTLSELGKDEVDQYLWDVPSSFTLYDEQGEMIDSCGGFYDLESIKEYLPAEFQGLDLKDYIVKS